MTVNPIETILKYCETINNNRNVYTIFEHAASEMIELEEEVSRCPTFDAPGEDGIFGEAIDVILCMVDIIVQDNPNVTMEEINNYIIKKCEKWKEKYSLESV